MTLPSELIADLGKNMRGSLRLDPAARILYSTDASIYQIEPLGVAIPRDQDDLQVIVAAAAKYKVPVLARGSGSSLAGQAIGPALIIDCSRWLDNILEIDPGARTATVEPGVILTSLNKALARHGLQFGPDPASAERATIGGVIANNATGAHSILYGMAADHLLEAQVVLADGTLATWGVLSLEGSPSESSHNEQMREVISAALNIREKYAQAITHSYPASWRNSAGYRLNYLLPWSASRPAQWPAEAYYPPVRPGTMNLAPLLAGSEGTLAVMRSVKLNLVTRPQHTVLAVLAYNGIAAACDDVPRLLRCEPSAIELIPRSIVQLAKSVPAYASQAAILDLEGEALLVVEFSGGDTGLLRKAAIGLHPSVIAESAEDQKRIWSVRKVGLGLLASRTGSAKTAAFIEDCAIPVEHLGDFVRGVEAILREYQAQAEFYAHASAGCLHIRPILDLKKQHRELRGIAEDVLHLTLSLHGSMSSEHGDGLARSEWLRETYGPELMDAFRSFKQAADPARILNPGKILDAPPMDANLRFGPGYGTKVWNPGFDFSREGGLAGAVEQCNGQGVCRKFDGTMCPSFQATREEMHSTRGRANLLRALISRPGLAGIEQDAHAALDLCLACKGCKSECPSGVDMAKLKFSFLAQYHKTHIRPLRDYIFGYFHTVSSLLAPVAPMANALMRFDPTRRLIAAVTGITSKRPFPIFSLKRARVQQVEGPVGGRVLFLSDAFTHFVEPEIEQAAFDLLAFAGYQVLKLPSIGAGASLISKGFIAPARKHAARLLDAIRELDPGGTMMVIGLEPPDIYALKNDFAALLPGRAHEATSISARTWLFDEFLIRSSTGLERLRIAIFGNTSGPEKGHKIHFQPHCHQRAEPPADDGFPSGAGATIALLKACGFAAEAIDSGCCGMAGTFGYEKEHYDLSMNVGKLKLFPAIQQSTGSDPGTIFLSTGSACRMQIEQGSTSRAEHPVAFLRRQLPPKGGARL